MTPGAPIAEVTRRDVRTGREVVESVHTGHLVVVTRGGDVEVAHGEPERSVYLRSTAKPFQAAACLELLEPGEHPSDAELAVAWSSHRAEPRHLTAVLALLSRSGTPPSALTCPPAVGEHDPAGAPTRLRRDCSGKHALFALVGARMGVRGPAVIDPDGPVQRAVLGLVDELLGPACAVAVDGCGAPAVARPLTAVAQGFAALAVDTRLAAVRRAGLTHPDLVGGRGRLETALLARGVVAKIGAEGVFGAGWIGPDGTARGLAVKAADGAHRASTAATIGLLEARGVVPVGTWAPPPPLGGQRPEGRVRGLVGV